jgi:hypothetical protein
VKENIQRLSTSYRSPNEINFFYFSRLMLELKPRMSKLQLCLFSLIKSECRPWSENEFFCRPTQMKNLLSPIVGGPVHLGSIERALKVLRKRNLVGFIHYEKYREVIVTFRGESEKPGYKRIRVPTEAMANPDLSHVAKLAFGRIYGRLQTRTSLRWSNKRFRRVLDNL